MTTPTPEQTPLERLLRLDGRTAIVTGGAMGIGRGIARRFVEAGAGVVIADVNGEAAEATARTLAEDLKSDNVMGVACDVANEASVRELMERTAARFGRVDILVNNAGIYPFNPVLDMSVEAWDRVQAVNMRGAFLCSREALRRMMQQGEGGAIINIGSIDSFHPSGVGLAAYDASKGGLLMFTRNLALEAAPHGVRVNLVAPGGIETEGTSGVDDAFRAQFVARVPLGRWGVPDDIAVATLFLAGPGAPYITGEAVVVDGGRLLS